MSENTIVFTEKLDYLNNLISKWSEKEDQDREEFIELLLEFDLVVNHLQAETDKNNDEELSTLLSHLQDNLIIFYESKVTENQIELICAWPIYLNEYVSNRNDIETKNSFIEYLSDPNWPSSYDPKGIYASSVDSIIQSYDTGSFDNELGVDSAISKPSPDDTSLNSEQLEFVGLISAELEDIQKIHGLRINELFESSDISDSSIKDELSIQNDQLDRIGSAADMVGLRGLKKFCNQIQLILNHIHDNDLNLLATLKDELLSWPDIIQGYLFSPDSPEYILAALDYLNLDGWPVHLNPVEQKDFESAFYNSKVEVDTSDQPERLQQASKENINLQKPDDVPDELFDSLLQDLPEQTAEFSYAVQKIRNNDYLEQLEISKRIAHTLKGAGNTVGIQGIATLTHHLEDILDELLKERAKPTQVLHRAIENAADCLEEMSEYFHGMGSEPENALETLQDVLNWANFIDENGVPTESDQVAVSETDSSNTNDEIQVVENITPQEHTKAALEDEAKAQSHPEQSLRVNINLIDNLLKRAGENIISNAQIQEYILRSRTQTKLLRENNNKVKNLINELEHLIEKRGYSSKFSAHNKFDKFDPLEMDQFNELNTYANLLIEAAADTNEFTGEIENSLIKLGNLCSTQKHVLLESQEAVLRTRMVPVKSITQRLKRSVKQANKLAGKSVQLKIIGEDVPIDSDILNQLVDPMMHILRNAVDHGIEAAEFRSKQGKTDHGTITLSFYTQGRQIHISCNDDGRGLDIERIKSKALEVGLLQEDEAFDKEDALKLILQHGFSTKENVSQLSGRGVGLDIVYAQIRDLKGSIAINSTYGKGTSIELSLPMTFHSTQAILVSSANNTLAISNRGIEEILHPGAGKITSIDGNSVFAYQQKRYPVFDLQGALFNEHNDETKEPSQAVLIIKDEFNNNHAILIDKILDSREIIVKPFSQFIPKMSGLLGSTIIGDGSVVSVLDLLDIVNIEEPLSPHTRTNKNLRAAKVSQQSALIVEDAISTRKLLAQFMTDLGFKVTTAKDGVEAIEQIQQNLPDLILTDLEMPRMNGLELTDHLRSNQETKSTPIIMITSRATDKHRKEAHRIGVTEYMTKPYDEDELLSLINTYAVYPEH